MRSLTFNKERGVKMKQINYFFVITTIVMLLLNSCQKPPFNVDNNIIATNAPATEYLESDTIMEESIAPSTANIDIINMCNDKQMQEEIISSNGDKLIINAHTEFDYVNKISLYKYIPLSISADMRQSIFYNYFGDRANEVFCKDENRDIWQLGETRTGDFYKYEISFPTDGSGDVVFVLSYRKPNLNYLDENLLDSANECSCLISPEEAKSQCDDFIMSLLGEGAYTIDSILAYGKNGQSPFYKVYYKRSLDNLPVNSFNDIYMFIDFSVDCIVPG